MAKLSRKQLESLLINAGFKKNSDTLNTMIGIAYAESGGDPNAHNGQGRDDSYGLWQINMKGAMGPARRKAFGIATNTALYDPATNAKAAYSVYKSQGLNAWTTYTSGRYLNYMDTTTTAEGGNKNPVTTVTDAASAVPNAINSSINAFGSTVFKGLSNIAGIAIAIVCVVLGIVILMRNQLPAGKVLKIAEKVAK